jgi:hypothetical protein
VCGNGNPGAAPSGEPRWNIRTHRRESKAADLGLIEWDAAHARNAPLAHPLDLEIVITRGPNTR